MQKSLALMGAFWNDPLTTGSLVPSSPVLARALASPIRVTASTMVVELGAGTGAITRALFHHGVSQPQYLGVEVNPTLAARLRTDYPDAVFAADYAENLVTIARRNGIHGASHVVASLPWTLLEPQSHTAILSAVARILRPGGRLLTFTYVPGQCLVRQSKHFKDCLRQTFRTTTLREIVWRNVPPALVWECGND